MPNPCHFQDSPHTDAQPLAGKRRTASALQGYLAHKKTPFLRPVCRPMRKSGGRRGLACFLERGTRELLEWPVISNQCPGRCTLSLSGKLNRLFSLVHRYVPIGLGRKWTLGLMWTTLCKVTPAMATRGNIPQIKRFPLQGNLYRGTSLTRKRPPP